MAVMVTGATGHLGPHLIAELLRAGDVDRVYVVARDTGPPAAARVGAIERIARAQLAAEGSRGSTATVIGVAEGEIRRLRSDVRVIVHAAANTRFVAPLEELRSTNVAATRELCQIAGEFPRLAQMLFVSTTCTAGLRTGRIDEQLLDDGHGFANAYEQTKWEGEQVVATSGLPARIARLSTCAGSHATGYVHRFGALHHLLHWISRGLVPMVPGIEQTPTDIIATDVAARWIARSVTRNPDGLEICHVALGDDSVPLGMLIDFLIPLLEAHGRRRLQRPLIVDEATFASFNEMVRLSGDALLSRVQASAAAMLPSLTHPKVYETSRAERCWGGPLPHAEWRALLSRVVSFGFDRHWGLHPAMESCHA
jgi:nucleoside-diphosphate-sugar epimerase